jgi:hypothetical protein
VSQDYQLLDWYVGDASGERLENCGTTGELVQEDVYIWFFLDHGDNTNYNLNVVAEYSTTNPVTGEVVVEAVEECLYEGEKIGTGSAYLFIDDHYVCGSNINITKFLISWTKLARTPCGQREPKCYCPGFDIGVETPLSGIIAGTDILCYQGENNGTADVTVYGGTAPYTYSWVALDGGTGLNPTAEDQSGLSPGTYEVTITDSNTTYDPDTETDVSDPYSVTLTVTIGEPTELIVASTSFTEPLCNGDANGTATVNVSGGTAFYSYSWNTSPVQTTQTATGLTAGTYTVDVLDANGCTTQATVTITEPPVLEAEIDPTSPLCFGDDNGSATVVVTGGTAPFTYLWSDGQTSTTATGLSAGNYSVTVTDVNNCSTVANITIDQPDALSGTISKTDTSCYTETDGTATINVTGGTAPYTYNWNTTPSQSGQTATGLAHGTYNVQVTDANNCVIYRNITINRPQELLISTEFTEPSCYNGANGGTASASSYGGTGQHTYFWSDGQTTQTANNLAEGTYTVVVTDENGCTATTSVEVTQPLQTFAEAGEYPLTDADCGTNSVELNATGVDSMGNTMDGVWTIISGTGGSFSNINDPDAEFTGLEGVTYTLRYSIDCAEDTTVITFPGNCSTLDFDGIDDHVVFYDNYNQAGSFSIEIWSKPESLSGTQTIVSKREANDLSTGYDLRLNNNLLELRFNNSFILQSAYPVTTNRWYHFAATYDGATAKLYIDGIEVASSGTAAGPTANDNDFIMGAMDNTITPPKKPLNYYEGWLDELRIWNVALTPSQIRHMMNQEINDDGSGNVLGLVVPLTIPGLSWSDLVGYYRMNQSVDLANSGYLSANDSTPTDGKLKNITTWQPETAPIPYVTDNDGDWNDRTSDANSPWEWGHTVWDYPNGIGVDNTTRIDWNIVETSHNVTSDASTHTTHDESITLLGLKVLANELTITDQTDAQDETNDGQGLWVTHYLELDGVIDLIGESQLVQKRYTPSQFRGSILATSSEGYIERDQQGTSNLYNYNDWSSPVGQINSIANNVPFTLGGLSGVLKDGTDSNNPQEILWTTDHDAVYGDPITLSSRWLYTFESDATNTYLAWDRITQDSPINVGLGYLMKGSGAPPPSTDPLDNTDGQNYVFKGKPNNSTITNPIYIWNQALVGNPYPSAIDAIEFIKDNIPTINPDGSQNTLANEDTTGSIDGTLYFWIHYESNNTHILEDYEAGYATIAPFTGSVAPVWLHATVDGYEISNEGFTDKLPGQYIPVGQGFFVSTSGLADPSDIYSPHPSNMEQVKFENDQRVFFREQEGSYENSSVFLEANPNNFDTYFNKQSTTSKSVQQEEIIPIIKRIRVNYISPEETVKQLLLGFVEGGNATDGIDYGYDSVTFPGNGSDLSWLVDEKTCIIQGVGSFDVNKSYPLNLAIAENGKSIIRLESIENFEEDIDVYIHDAILNTYTNITEEDFEIELDINDYSDRFFMTFIDNSDTLTVDEKLSESLRIYYLQNSNELYLNWSNIQDIQNIELVNMLGQSVSNWNSLNIFRSGTEIRIPVKQIADGNYIVKASTVNGQELNKKVLIIN